MATKPYTSKRNYYQGAELKPHPGMPESRMRAFTLPSRAGDRLYYPDGRVSRAPSHNKESS